MALSFISQSSGLTNMQLGAAVVSLTVLLSFQRVSNRTTHLQSSLSSNQAFPVCLVLYKESPQIYCNLTVNLLSFWLWVSSLAYPQIPLERVLRALLSSSVRGIVQIIVHRNQSALVADQAEGKGQGSKAQGAKRTGAGINH